MEDEARYDAYRVVRPSSRPQLVPCLDNEIHLVLLASTAMPGVEQSGETNFITTIGPPPESQWPVANPTEYQGDDAWNWD